MTFLYIIFALSIFSTIVYFLTSSQNKLLSQRKDQSSNLLKENVLKKQFEIMLENRVDYAKRNKVETMCLQSGLKINYAEFLIISFVSSFVFFLVTFILLKNILFSLMFLFVGYIVPKQAILFLKNRRIELMERQIGSFLNMILKRYEVTNDFKKTIETTALEFKNQEPIYSEIKQTVLEMDLGIASSKAIENMAIRTGNKYMLRFADYFEISSNLGIDARKKILPQAYIQFEENRKDKLSMKRQLSEPKREAYIMLLSIPIFAVYQSMTNPSYLDFMIGTLTGKVGITVISFVLLGCIWFINNKIGAPLE